MSIPNGIDVPAGVDVAELAELALAVATEAGRLIVDDRPTDVGVADTKSSVTDVVTVMDRAAQDLIRERLAAARPEDDFFGEEDGARPATPGAGITWVVDPIDGTVNYLYKIPACAVSVAAVVGDPLTPGAWRPVAGAVVNPASGESFVAWAGGGAYRIVGGDRTPIRASSADRVETALVGTGFSYDQATRAWQAQVLTQILPTVRDIRRMGSAALDLCHVADGSLDAYYERCLNPWDMAAGWLVCTEAGAVVGGPASSSEAQASSPDVSAPEWMLTWAAAPAVADGIRAVILDAIAHADAAG